MTRQFILSLLFLVAVSAAQAAPTALNVESCVDREVLMVLSSVAVSHEGEAYLVTPLQLLQVGSGADYCYSYQDSIGQRQALELVGVDWPHIAVFSGEGLAPTVEDWVLGEPKAPTVIRAEAVSRTTRKALSQKGIIASIQSRRGLSGAQTEVRLKELSSELVGALVYDATTNKALGLISGFYMQFQPHGPSLLRAWDFWNYRDEPSIYPGTYFLINPGVIHESLRRVLQRKSQDHLFWVNEVGGPVLVSGELMIMARCPGGNSQDEGHADFPIGGVDMVGIGGSVTTRGCVIEITRALMPTAEHLPWLDLGDTYDKLLHELKSGGERIEVHYLYKEPERRDLPMERQLLLGLQSLQWGLEQEETPVLHVFKKGQRVAGKSADQRELAALAEEVTALGSEVFDSFRRSNGSGVLTLLREIYFVARVSQAEEAQEILRAEYLQRLLNDEYYASAWRFATFDLAGGNPLLRTKFEELMQEFM